MSDLVQNAVGVVMAATALCAGIGYLVKKARAAARTLDAISALVDQELSHNHGSSMKDDVGGIAVAVGKLQRQVEDLETSFNDHLKHPRETR